MDDLDEIERLLDGTDVDIDHRDYEV